MSDTVTEMQAEDAVTAPLPEVGAQLRAAREGKGWQVADIAQTLKLGTRQVEALENSEWALLPGATFIRGFVRNYARLVALDPIPLLTQLEGLLEKPSNSLSLPESKPASMPSPSSGNRRRDRLVVFSGISLALLAILLYLMLPGDLGQWRGDVQSWIDSLARQDAPTPQAPAEAEFPPGATVQQVISPQAETPAEGGATVPVPDAAKTTDGGTGMTTPVKSGLRFVVEKDSWVEVRDRADNVVFSQRLSAGSEQLVEGSGPFSVVLGNAPGVKLYWRAQAVDLQPHTRGDVARLVLE